MAKTHGQRPHRVRRELSIRWRILNATLVARARQRDLRHASIDCSDSRGFLIRIPAGILTSARKYLRGLVRKTDAWAGSASSRSVPFNARPGIIADLAIRTPRIVCRRPCIPTGSRPDVPDAKKRSPLRVVVPRKISASDTPQDISSGLTS
jgi:hypothetical protein